MVAYYSSYVRIHLYWVEGGMNWLSYTDYMVYKGAEKVDADDNKI